MSAADTARAAFIRIEGWLDQERNSKKQNTNGELSSGHRVANQTRDPRRLAEQRARIMWYVKRLWKLNMGIVYFIFFIFSLKILSL